MTRYVLIAGNGRSGSNRLLDILDQSPRTVCRNEMNAVMGGEFNEIGGLLFLEDMTDARAQKLNGAIGRAKRRRSERDRAAKVVKDHYRKQWLGDVIHLAMSKSKLRAAMARTPLLKSDQEWNVPTLITDPKKLAEAILVLKLNAGPAWAVYLHQKDPEARIIHNIRDPRAYLNSWYNRFAADKDAAHFEKHFRDIPRIFAHFDSGDYGRLRDFSQESRMEIELWRWRYTNEILHTALLGSDRAMTITYKAIDKDPVGAAEQIYAVAGLELNDQTRKMVKSMRNTLFAKKHSIKLENDHIDAMIERVLDGSPLLNITDLVA